MQRPRWVGEHGEDVGLAPTAGVVGRGGWGFEGGRGLGGKWNAPALLPFGVEGGKVESAGEGRGGGGVLLLGPRVCAAWRIGPCLALVGPAEGDCGPGFHCRRWAS